VFLFPDLLALFLFKKHRKNSAIERNFWLLIHSLLLLSALRAGILFSVHAAKSQAAEAPLLEEKILSALHAGI